jgi:hypothetical protein
LQPAFRSKASYIGKQLEETIINHYLKYWNAKCNIK